MFRTLFCLQTGLALLLTATLTSGSAAAMADTQPDPLPELPEAVAETQSSESMLETQPQPIPLTSPPTTVSGVNLISKALRLDRPDIAIGPQDATSKIELIRSNEWPNDTAYWGSPSYSGAYHSAFAAGWTHNYNINLQCSYTWQDEANDPSGYICGYHAVAISVGTTTEVFDEDAIVGGWITYSNRSKSGAMLRATTSSSPNRTYHYIARDGSVTEFIVPQNGVGSTSIPNCGTYCWYAKYINFRNDERITFSYENRTSRDASMHRLQSAVSNRGFGLRFGYEERPGQYFNIANANSVTAFTRQCSTSCIDSDVGSAAYQYVPYPGVPNTPQWPTQFAYLSQFTDVSGRTERYDYSSSGFGIVRPSTATAAKFRYSPQPGPTPLTGPYSATLTEPLAQTMTFAWTAENGSTGSVQVTDALNKSTTYGLKIIGMFFPNSYDHTSDILRVVSSATDPLGRLTQYDYDGHGRPISVTSPDGQKVEIVLDGNADATLRTEIPKAGSGLANIVRQYAYMPCSHVTIVQCHNMSYEIDPLSNRTDYGWNARGELESIMAPPDSSGVRPTTMISYIGHPAVGGGAIYLPHSKQTSISSTQSVITTWGYDASKGYALKEEVVSSGGTLLRTCYTNDNWGRRTSETKPAADLSVCP